MQSQQESQAKTIGLAQGVALYMGAVLGSGILILPGFTADIAGPASIVSWIILSLLSIPMAYSFARLALRFSHYGGIATIVGSAFGFTASALVGWFFFVWVSVGPAVVGLTGAAYVAAAFGLTKTGVYAIALAFIVVALVANWLGMRISGYVSLALSGGVLVLLLATIGFALPEMETANFSPWAPNGWSGIGQACVLIFWAFFGWENITHLVPEFRRPQRDVMRSMWLSVFIVGMVYTLLALVTIGTHTYGVDGASAPLAVLMNRTLGVSAGLATAIVACIVCIGTLNVYFASSTRLGYAMAEERKLPSWFAAMNRAGFPYRTALFLCATNTIALIASYLWDISVDQLILVPTTLGIFVYVIASFACVKLLWSDPVGRISALLSAVCCLAVAPFALGYLAAPIVVAALCLVYLRFRRRNGINLSD